MARYGNEFGRGRQGGYGQRFEGRYDREFGAGSDRSGGRRPGGQGRPGARGYRGGAEMGEPGGGFGGGFGASGYGGGGYAGRGGWETGHRGRDDQGVARMRASEIMTDDPHSVTPDTPVSEVAKKMRELDVGIIPVVDDRESRRLRGVITDRDIAMRVVADGKDGNVKVQDVMTEQVDTVNKNDSVQDVIELMQRDQIRRVPVTDREGRLVGIIAQADIAVDLMEHGGQQSKRMVARTLERISEPGEPERSGRGRGTGGSRAASGGEDRETGTT
jgi:CBS domain-containing protein